MIPVYRNKLTQISNWTIARDPMDAAICNGYLPSAERTDEFIWSGEDKWASTLATLGTLPLEMHSISWCPIGSNESNGARNSFFSYLLLIHFSFSSLDEDGMGLVRPLVLNS